MKILGLSGSLRAQSSNSALLRAAAVLAPEGMELTVWDSQLGELPHFNPDLDGEGSTPPPSVAAFRAAVRGCDGVLISCPEYAHGVPGSFKNALDWLVSSGELSKKPVAVLMASPGGAQQAQAALMPTLRVLEARLVFQTSLVFLRKHLDAQERVADARVAAVVRESLGALAALSPRS